MTVNKTLTLYSTSHCHLCDAAAAILNKMPAKPFAIVEITDNEQLLLTYGTRIPVLRREDNSAELNWPFNAQDIVQFLSD
ncbi:MAG: glutaredoxin family protein [Pseudomonadota bacterium]